MSMAAEPSMTSTVTASDSYLNEATDPYANYFDMHGSLSFLIEAYKTSYMVNLCCPTETPFSASCF